MLTDLRGNLCLSLALPAPTQADPMRRGRHDDDGRAALLLLMLSPLLGSCAVLVASVASDGSSGTARTAVQAHYLVSVSF